MKKSLKKYPLLVCLIISCVLVIGSIFVLAFCGLKLSPSLGGGSQFEIAIPDSANTKDCVQDIKSVLKKNDIVYDSFLVEDKPSAEETATEISQRYIVVNINKTNISDEKELKIRQDISEKLGVSIEKVSSIENIVSSIKSKDILLFGLGVGIVTICLFIFGFIRYDVFAGLSFLLSNLHNVILFFSIIILTRLRLGLVPLAAISILTLITSAILVSIFEKNKIESELHLADKETPSERLLRVEKKAVLPYIFVAVAVLFFAILLFFVPVNNILFSSLSIIVALAVSIYTTLFVGPGVYGYFLDIKKSRFDATLSRNDTVNKVIKKRIAKSKKPLV